MYDVLPAACGEVNDESFALKDYGDAGGDTYFAIRSVLPPLLCDTCRREEPTREALCVRYNGIAVGTCYSEQAYEGVQVARRIEVEVPDGEEFGAYGACNPPEHPANQEELCGYECVESDRGAGVYEGVGAQHLPSSSICNAEVGRRIAGEAEQGSDAVRALHYDYNLCTTLSGWWYSIGNASFAGRLWRNPRLLKAIDQRCQMPCSTRRCSTPRARPASTRARTRARRAARTTRRRPATSAASTTRCSGPVATRPTTRAVAWARRPSRRRGRAASTSAPSTSLGRTMVALLVRANRCARCCRGEVREGGFHTRPARLSAPALTAATRCGGRRVS